MSSSYAAAAAPVTFSGFTVRDGNGGNGPDNGFGAGIYNEATLTLDSMRVAENRTVATGGGGGAGIVNLTNASLVITGSEILSNTASHYGGGIATLTGATLEIINSRLVSNTAATNGGAIFNDQGVVRVNGSTLQSNVALAGGGGAVDSRGTLQVDNSSVLSNSATVNGGGLVSTGSLAVANSLFAMNVAQALGGAIGSEGFFTITASALVTNTALQGGGGIGVVGSAVVEHTTLESNTAAAGGGIGGAPAASIAILDSQIVSNTAPVKGGGLFLGGGTVLVSATTVQGNESTLGGGIYTISALELHDSSLFYNTATDMKQDHVDADGGGLYVDNGGDATVVNTILAGNLANTHGGGIYLVSSVAMLGNSTVTDNAARQGGGVYVATAGSLLAVNATIAYNTARSGSQAEMADGSDGMFGNTLLAHGTAPTAPNCAGPAWDIGSNLDSDGSCHFPPTFGSLSGMDPLLGALGDYGGATWTMPLLPGSPAIDAGGSGVCNSFPVNSQDQRGVTRPQVAACDLGAFESQGFTLTLAGGDNQQAEVNAPFTAPLSVTVSSQSWGGMVEPVDGGIVTYTAPASGASITAAPEANVTITNGAAELAVTANNFMGGYVVTATAPGENAVIFHLANTPYASSTTLAVTPNPALVDDNVVFTVAVAKAATLQALNLATPTGVVTVTDGTGVINLVGALVNGEAVLYKADLPAGSYSVTATYGGDATYAGSASGATVLVVNQYASTTDLSSYSNPVYVGDTLNFAAVVSKVVPNGFGANGYANYPTGVVTFTDESGLIYITDQLNYGTVVVTAPWLSAGMYTVTAQYSGDYRYLPSTSNLLVQVVQRVETTTALSSTSNPVFAGDPLSFNVLVSEVLPDRVSPRSVCDALATNTPVNQTDLGQCNARNTLGAPVGPTGVVTVTDSSGLIHLSGQLVNGALQLAAPWLPAGTYTVTAQYGGSDRYLPSTSTVLVQVVEQIATNTVLLSSSNPVFAGDPLSFNVLVSEVLPDRVSPQSVCDALATNTPVNQTDLGQCNARNTLGAPVGPTGVVSVTDGSGLIHLSGQLVNGAVQLAAPWLPAGTYTVTARYGGNNRYAPSTGAALMQVVQRHTTDTMVAVTPNPAQIGDQLAFTATVSLNDSAMVMSNDPASLAANGVLSGVVQFMASGTRIGSAAVVNGVAYISGPAPSAGTFAISAVYLGNDTYAGSGSVPVELEIARHPSATALASAPNPSRPSESVLFTATVSELTVVQQPKDAATEIDGFAVNTLPTPTGEIIFAENGIEFGRAALVNGVATFANTLLPVGDHPITAEYGGDEVYAGSASPIIHQVVQPLPTAVNDAAGTQQATPVTVDVLANDFDPAGGGLMVSAITLQPAHGMAQVSANRHSVLYTPDASFAGHDSFVYVAEDINGNTDDALATIVVSARRQTEESPQIAPVDPQVDNSKPFTSPDATVNVQLSAGFYPDPLDVKDILFLSYTPILTPTDNTQTPPGSLKFGNFEFDLTLFLNDQPQHGVQFAPPITVTIAYSPALLNGLKEESLEIYSWNGAAWSTSGITIVARDLTNHTITLALAHLTEFAFFAALPTDLPPTGEPDLNQKLFFPGVMRSGAAVNAEQVTEADMANQIYLPVLRK